MRRRDSERLSESERQRVRDLYNAGVSRTALSKRFGVTHSSIGTLTRNRLCMECGEPLNCLNQARKRHVDCKPLRCECGNRLHGRAKVCANCAAMAETASGELKAAVNAQRHALAVKHVSTSVYVRHDEVCARYTWRIAVQR